MEEASLPGMFFKGRHSSIAAPGKAGMNQGKRAPEGSEIQRGMRSGNSDMDIRWALGIFGNRN